MRRLLLMCLLIALSICAGAQSNDVLGMHDLSPSGGSPIKGGLSPCLFCHAPHSGINGPFGAAPALWSQKLSTATNYTLYSGTLTNPQKQPGLGSSSNLCLSCHDGTVAPGQTTPYGAISMQGAMNGQDVFGTNLSTVHPFNFDLGTKGLQCTGDMFVCNGVKPGNPAVQLEDGNVQCTTCHNPHVQGIDPVSQQFLVMDNTGSALCLSCHSPVPQQPVTAAASSASRVANSVQWGQGSAPQQANVRPVASASKAATSATRLTSPWAKSIHAVASHKVGKGAELGPYGTVKQNGCLSCHATHSGRGDRALLTGPVQPVPNMDPVTQNCTTCHGAGSTITPALPNVMAEFAKTGHPFPTDNNKHASNESTVLDKNRHATCVDCHDPHAAVPTGSFETLALRGSQAGVAGVSEKDGSTALTPAVNQYQTCLRCHGTSVGKQVLPQFGHLPARVVSSGDPLNIIPQFQLTASSSHPVMHDRNSALPQPSLLQYIWNLDGKTQGRQMGARILCTDCHNSDDNREFGGNGPNGPHGSQYSHILERRYEMSQVAPAPAGGPGTTITNLFPNPVLDAACASYPCASPYALCAKCHDLNNLVANTSFSQHGRHINAGFSCSVCHTAHGMGASSAGVSGERMVNFDAQVVGPTGSAAISYTRAKNTCTLTCHNVVHNADGSVSAVSKTALPPNRIMRSR